MRTLEGRGGGLSQVARLPPWTGQSSLSPPVLVLELSLCTRGCSLPTHRLSSALDSAPGQGSVGAQRSVTSIQALFRGYGPSQALPVSQPRSLGFGTSQAFSLSPVMETLPCPYVPAGLPVSCPFLFPGLRILPSISCPRVEALTYSLSLRILCAPDSLPQCSGPSQSPCQSSV